ncbi:ATP-binding protein [Lichenihabitans sp. PAMC28606]|uniref:ATP-binding protein n=1 Tax=Lichenihabitans sp. PAMC28606 TaxID=2880932 RepID=UPI001D0B4509|nr:ATP-binding protein [Lichenihabitans sp. PAMC28606]UDL93618.1 ATP-binding protein [Lichenihabitans sp. PAMC28606]
MSLALDALRDADFGWLRSLESVWSDADTTVGGPNEALLDSLVADFFRKTKEASTKPPGHVLVGAAGIGKTHLVGTLRRRTWDGGGWFVLLDILGVTDFWKSAALSFLTSLLQEMPDGRRQHEAVLAGVARRFQIERQVHEAFETPNIDPSKIVDLLVGGLMRGDRVNALRHQDVFRALALLRSNHAGTMSFAHSWLQGYEAEEDTGRKLGFKGAPPTHVELVRGMSWIMSLAGPTLVAVDQIDSIVIPSNMFQHRLSEDGRPAQPIGEVLAAGLLELYDVLHRSMTVVTCLYDSWERIKAHALDSAVHRFQPQTALLGMGDRAHIENLIVSRLTPAYAAVAFTPAFPSWPFSKAAIDNATGRGMTPRAILMRCDAFRRHCIDEARIELCDSLLPVAPEADQTIENTGPQTPLFDLEAMRRQVDIAGLIQNDDDGEFGRLLRGVFGLYAVQIDPDEAIDVEAKGDSAQCTPPLHGRLTFTFHAESDRERHYCYRALEHTNANAFQSRLRAALTASGITADMADRRLLIIRKAPVPGGVKTRQMVEVFTKAGGCIIDPSEDDLMTFVALRQLRDEAANHRKRNEFDAWLRATKPLCDTAFFKQAGLCPPPGTSVSDVVDAMPAPPVETVLIEGVATAASPVAAPLAEPKRPTKRAVAPPLVAVPPTAIVIGHRMAVGGEAVSLPLALLPRHTAIIAGSGSGKTVLLRRLIEEAALAGIPAIVIDPNNDLSRLGDPWPERPGSFTPDDDEKAARYRETVEVVVWTPGVRAGNPLFLSVLPDFSGLGDNLDERDQACEMATETVAPLAGAKNGLQRGVLADAMRYFAGQGGGDLKAMTTLLTDLPDGISEIGNAAKLAAGMADQLHAAVATNPLLRVDGPVLDPKRLFNGPDAGRTRISVINLSGLASDAAREDFVNRLQMTLFSWIKKNPSPTGRLYAIDEAQNFMPSAQAAISRGSAVRLFAQARKYGLGMVVATQAPKGIDNKIVSNCTTQFFGKQNSPTDIGSVKDLIAGKGGAADDVAKLAMGEFYFASEKSGKPAKIRTPICLSYHPANPPTPEEVVVQAKRSVR